MEKKYSREHKFVVPAIVALLSAGSSTAAFAMDIDTGNPDVAMTWNNTLRYNWAQRMQAIDQKIALASPPAGATYGAYSAGDNLFKKGDTITNRLDVLSELNFAYQGKYGFRVSAAAWYDNAYAGKNPTPSTNVPGRTTSYQNSQFTDYVERYYKGPSGEWLDAYVFGNFELSGTDLNVRLGRHAVVWGEGLFGSTHSIAFSQAPSDGRKGVSSPGASAKETALPVNQISATAVLSPEVTLLAQYQFEWVANRVPEGGTYFAPADVVLWGPNVNRDTEFKRGEKGGYGLGLKWSPEWLDGTVGFYYRKFDDKNGWIAQQTGLGSPNPFNTTAVWGKDIELYGVSLSKSVLGVSVGAEVSYRKNDPLSSMATASAATATVPGGAAAAAAGNFDGAVGNTWHAVLNGVQTYGSSPIYDSASLAGEIAWEKLDKITRNPTLYKSMTAGFDCAAAATRRIRGCETDDDYFSVGLSYSANWLQVYPGVDLSMPLFFSKNFTNAQSNGGGTKGFVTYKAGLTATAWTKHIFDLSYTWFDQNVDRVSPNVGGNSLSGRIQGVPYSDKGFLAFTYQTTF
jgi:hypothetical protein